MFDDVTKYIFIQFEINMFNCGDFTLVQFLGGTLTNFSQKSKIPFFELKIYLI